MPPPKKSVRRYDRAFYTDMTIRIVLALYFAFSAGMNGRTIIAQLRNVDLFHPNLSDWSHLLAVIAVGVYALMVAIIYVLRLRPVNKFAGFFPTLTALLGGFLLYALIWCKLNTALSPTMQIIASLLILGGNAFGVYALMHLGRSFSILPEGRRLVRTGPYKYIRHPLYTAEAVAICGTMILFFSPLAVALVVVQCGMQLGRIHYEERVLSKTFPEYKTYARKTARLVPGVY